MTESFGKLSRALFLSLLSVVLAFPFFLPARAAAQTTGTNLKLGLLPIESCMQAFTAKDKGFFREEGLHVTTTFMAGGAVVAPAVEGGGLQVGFSNAVSIILAYSKGFDFQFLAEGGIHLAQAPTLQIMVRKDSGINSPKDLEGKVIGVNTLGGIDEVTLRAWAREKHVDLKKARVIEVPFPQMVPALASGRVQAVMAGEPFMTLAELQADAKPIGVPWDSIARRLMISGYFVKKSWAQSNRRTAEAFVKAIARATRFMNSHPRELGAILADNTRIKGALANRIVHQAYRERFHKADLQVWINPLYELGFIPKKFDVSAIISPLALMEK